MKQHCLKGCTLHGTPMQCGTNPLTSWVFLLLQARKGPDAGVRVQAEKNKVLAACVPFARVQVH